MPTIPAAALFTPERQVMGTTKVVIGRLNLNAVSGAYVAGGDDLPAASLGLDAIDDIHFANPGRRAGPAFAEAKFVPTGNGDGKVLYHLQTTGAELTGSNRPDDLRFIAFGR